MKIKRKVFVEKQKNSENRHPLTGGNFALRFVLQLFAYKIIEMGWLGTKSSWNFGLIVIENSFVDEPSLAKYETSESVFEKLTNYDIVTEQICYQK